MSILNFFLPAVLSLTQSFSDPVLLNSFLMDTQNRRHIVNDVVMGGRSSSATTIIENGIILFEGNISLKNNGGFASLRSPIKNYNFNDYSGLEIRIKGDGKIYSVSTKETTYFTGLFFTTNFF
ncbi:MAG: CIA30 family protein [Melioribacteraceae bacterium]|nr:CIA30 family protein [Melioribacteraceae bacterium]